MTLSFDPPKLAVGDSEHSRKSSQCSLPEASHQAVPVSQDCLIKPDVSLAPFTSLVRLNGTLPPAQLMTLPLALTGPTSKIYRLRC